MIWLLAFVLYLALLVVFLKKSKRLDKSPRPRRSFLYKNNLGEFIFAIVGVILVVAFLFFELSV